MNHETIVWSMEVDQNEDKENIDEEVIEDAELIESIIAKMSKLLINSSTPYKLKKNFWRMAIPINAAIEDLLREYLGKI